MKYILSILGSAVVVAALSTSVAIAGPGAAGHHDAEVAYGKPGDPKKPARIVQIRMGEGDGKMFFAPPIVEIKKGEQVRFKLMNGGELDHELVIATLQENLKHAEEMKKNPEMEHDDPNSKTIQPKKKAEIVWRFSKAGTFEFACLIPGHREAGMIGTVGVK